MTRLPPSWAAPPAVNNVIVECPIVCFAEGEFCAGNRGWFAEMATRPAGVGDMKGVVGGFSLFGTSFSLSQGALLAPPPPPPPPPGFADLAHQQPRFMRPMLPLPPGVFDPAPPPPPGFGPEPILPKKRRLDDVVELLPIPPPPPPPLPAPSSSANSVDAKGKGVTNSVAKGRANIERVASSGGGVKAAQKLSQETLYTLYCKLCDAKLNGKQQAAAHYEGKNHKKKERRVLEARVAQISPAATKKHYSLNPTFKAMQDTRPEISYCRICDVHFNSDSQATQHYNGKNHKKKAKDPFNQKLLAQPSMGQFKKQSAVNLVSAEPMLVDPSRYGSAMLTCDVCQVMVPPADFDAHLKGPAHKVKADTLQMVMPQIMLHNLQLLRAQQECMVAEAEVEVAERKRDFSMYRTPSGKFYCSGCNVTLTSESQLSQHLDSKRHKSKVGMIRHR